MSDKLNLRDIIDSVIESKAVYKNNNQLFVVSCEESATSGCAHGWVRIAVNTDPNEELDNEIQNLVEKLEEVGVVLFGRPILTVIYRLSKIDTSKKFFGN